MIVGGIQNKILAREQANNKKNCDRLKNGHY